ncbi:MAG TPA: von Willebrand factor type A domain-containing protein [Opitutaceae bacterium]
MNNDEHNPGTQNQISAGLEARLLAWVSGEATADEIAELERLVAGKPELAAHKRRIEATLRVVADGLAADREPMRMSESRRAALLKELGATAKAPEIAVTPSLVALRRKQRMERQWMMAAAACVTVGLFLSFMLFPSYQKGRKGYSEETYALADVRVRKAAVDEKKENSPEGAEMRREGAVTLSAPQISVPPMPEADDVAAPAPAPVPAEAGKAKAWGGFYHQTEQVDGAAVLNNAQSLPSAQQPGVQVSTDGVTTTTTYTAPAHADVESEEPTVLSPFVVDATEDKGSYRANSTLAGTRIRTDLKDVSSAITVVTTQALQDASARNVDDLFNNAPKTAVISGSGSPQAPALDSNGKISEVVSSMPANEIAQAAPAALAKISAGTGSDETNAAKDPVSTFSLHVSDVSFRLAQAALARGEVPDPARIRPEEFYNAFAYDDPAPAMTEKVSCHTEQAIDPVAQERNLVRIAMKVPATGRSAAQPLRLTVLLDTSGSMEREDRATAVRSAFKVLVSLLGAQDRVTLVGFSRQPRLLAKDVPGDKAGSLLGIIAHTPPDGGTNLEEAIKLGGELAQEQFEASAQNRIVVLTDGAANLGDADPARLAALVEKLRQSAIAFDACGVGAGGIDDSVLEALTRKGSGRYYVLDSPEAADVGFARQLAGAFHPAAENVKVQVRFNPSRVGNYRLIGFENHRLNEADFRNDHVAAAALAGGEAAVALYEVQVLPQGDGDLGQVFVRFRDTATGGMVERSWPLSYDANAPAFAKASPSMQLAGTAALLAEKLRGGARGDAIELDPLAPIVNALRGHFSHQAQVQELAAMYEQMRRLRRE